MNSAARSGSTPIIVRNVEPSRVTSYAIEPMMHGAPAFRAASMPSRSSSSEVCVSMMMASAPAATSAAACSSNASRTSCLREVAVGLHQPAERADVADHVARAAAERLARDRDGRGVDGRHVAAMPVAREHDA